MREFFFFSFILIFVLAYRLNCLEKRLQDANVKTLEHMSESDTLVYPKNVELHGNLKVIGEMVVENNGHSMEIAKNGNQINCYSGNNNSNLHFNKNGGQTVTHHGASVAGKLRFRHEGENDDSDPYYLEKVHVSDNRNSLRLTLNDDDGESFQIWGGSCGEGDCVGPGKLLHKFSPTGAVINGPTHMKGGPLLVDKYLRLMAPTAGIYMGPDTNYWRIGPNDDTKLVYERSDGTGWSRKHVEE